MIAHPGLETEEGRRETLAANTRVRQEPGFTGSPPSRRILDSALMMRLRRYQRRGDVTALLPAPRGVSPEQRSLDSTVEAIIRFAVTRKLESGNCTV